MRRRHLPSDVRAGGEVVSTGKQAAIIWAAIAAGVLVFGVAAFHQGTAEAQEWRGVPRTQQSRDMQEAREYLRRVMNNGANRYDTRTEAARVLLDSWRVCTW